MSGKFTIDREIFDNPIWRRPIEFRLFFYIVGKAVWKEEGIKVRDIHIERGQYLRSYRNLRQDLSYEEDNTEKLYGIATIKRAVDKLVEDGRLTIFPTKHGTLFTVVNYEVYQQFGGAKVDEYGEPRNTCGTPAEHLRNKKKKDNKDNNNTTPKFGEGSIEYQLANLLYEKILLDDERYKKPNLHKWAEDIDKLIRLDNRTPQEIKMVIEFAKQDEFWKPNIMSTSKLRKQFPQLLVKAKQKGFAPKTENNALKDYLKGSSRYV